MRRLGVQVLLGAPLTRRVSRAENARRRRPPRVELSVSSSVEIAVTSQVAPIRGGRMSKKTKIIVGVAVVLGLGAILAFSLGGRDRNLPKVTTAKVEKVDLVAKVTANGKIQ